MKNKWKSFAVNQVLSSWDTGISADVLYDQLLTRNLTDLFDQYDVVEHPHFSSWSPALLAHNILKLASQAEEIAAEEFNFDFDPNTQIAIIWDITDVQEIRSDLSNKQAMEVLQKVKTYHNAEIGVSWDTLSLWAEHLYPEEDEEGYPNT